jgi:hypothetical protein
MMWVRDEMPQRCGYYLTYYLNPENDKHWIKAFWFDTNKGEWSYRFKPGVVCWWSVRHDFYVPCQSQPADPIPEEWRVK